jgi:hypothetical protein
MCGHALIRTEAKDDSNLRMPEEVPILEQHFSLESRNYEKFLAPPHYDYLVAILPRGISLGWSIALTADFAAF